MKYYDKLLNLAKFDPVSQLLAINFFKRGSSLHIFDLKNESIYYSLPSEPVGSNSQNKVNIPLQVHFSSDQDAFLVAYAFSNLVTVHSLNSRSLHPWSTSNPISKLTKEFKNRYNKIVGIVERSPSKFVFYSHYTWFLLDLD